MHYKSSSHSPNNQDHRLPSDAIQPNHRALKHTVYAAGASAALSLLLMTGCSCSPNQDAQETIPNTGASTTVNTTVQASPETQATNQSDTQDTTNQSATAQSTGQKPATQETQAEADARVKAAEEAQRQAEAAEAQLQEELEAAQKAQSEAESAAQTAQDEKDALQRELEIAQEAQAAAETDAQALFEEKEATQADAAALAADNEKLTTDLQTAQAAQAKAEESAQTAKESQAKAEEAQSKAEADLAKTTEELTSTTAQLQKAQEAIEAVEESTKANAEELAAAQEAQKNAEADKAHMQQELDNTIAAKEAAEAAADQAQQENASLVDANAAAEEARIAAEEQAAAAKAAQAEAEAKVEAGLVAAADVEAAQAAQAQAEADAQTAKEAQVQAEADAQAAKEAQAKAEEEKQKLQAERDALQAQLDALNAGTTTPDTQDPENPVPGDNPGSADAPAPGDEPSTEPSAPSDNPSTIPGTNALLRPNRFNADNYFAYGMAVRPSLGAYSWNEIASIASFIEAHATTREEAIELAKTFNLVAGDGTFTGETKAITFTDGQTVDVLLVDIFHDYTELDEPTAFTFMLANNYADQPMNASGTNEGGWELSDMRYWLNNEVVEKLPDALYYSVKPVQKFTNNIGSTNNPESVTPTTDLLFLFSWAECLGPLSWNEGTDLAYIDAVNNAEGAQYAWFAQEGVAGEQNNPTLIRTNASALPMGTTSEEVTANEGEEGIPEAESAPSEQTSTSASEASEITWWMRSSDPSSTTNFGDMGPELENGGVASTPEGVVFGFCL